MKHTSQQSAGSATPSTHNEFSKASIRLTVYYAAGVFLVLALFSFLVYTLFVRNLEFDSDDGGYVIATQLREPLDADEAHKAEDARERLMSTLLFVDLIALLLIIIVSYLLSRATLRPIEKSYIRQKRFVSDAAHELRTPLAVMKAGAEVLVSGKPTQTEYASFVTESLNEINFMSQMTDNLLFLARRDAAPKTHLPSVVSLSHLCEHTVALMRPYALSRRVALSGTVEEDVSVRGYDVNISRLLMNVLKNAIDYNKQNGIVELSLSRRGKDVFLEVRDTGIGIAPEDMEHIFDRFYKADTSRGSGYTEGSGLGLSIVKEIVDEMHGSVSVSSDVGKGTSVKIRLTTAM